MGEIKGFLKYKRQAVWHRPVKERVKDFAEFELPITPDQAPAGGGTVYGLRDALFVMVSAVRCKIVSPTSTT